MRLQFPSAAALAAVRARGAEAGARQNLDRFAAHLATRVASRHTSHGAGSSHGCPPSARGGTRRVERDAT